MGCFSREWFGLPRPHTLLCAHGQPGKQGASTLGLCCLWAPCSREGLLSPESTGEKMRGRRAREGRGLRDRDKDSGRFAGWESEVDVHWFVEKPQTAASEETLTQEVALGWAWEFQAACRRSTT